MAFAGADQSDGSWPLARRWWERWCTIDRSGQAAYLTLLAVALTDRTLVLSYGDTFSSLAIILWAMAIVLLLMAGMRLDGLTGRMLWANVRSLGDPSHRPEVLSVAVITLVAAALRIYDLEGYPPPFHGDEGEMGMYAIGALRGDRFPFFTTVPSWFPMFNYLQAGSMLAFGQTVWGLRILSVVLGVATIPVVYALGRLAWGPIAVPPPPG